jgi:hypothetical protein
MTLDPPGDNPTVVMAGLVPAIHVLAQLTTASWMPGTMPGMTAHSPWTLS